jgi:hypothetical protein
LATYTCADTYRTVAQAIHTAVDGEVDTHAADDVCPRAPLPGGIDPNPDGSIKDKGCGAKNPDGTIGGDVLTVVSPAP